MTVYLLFRETNSGHGDESDGYVEAVYATREAADAACLRNIRRARDAGEAVWRDPDNPSDHGAIVWTHDWHVEGHTVRE